MPMTAEWIRSAAFRIWRIILKRYRYTRAVLGREYRYVRNAAKTRVDAREGHHDSKCLIIIMIIIIHRSL